MRGRHHALSLLVTVLALALGLGLGAGPVAEETLGRSEAREQRLSDRVERLQGSVGELRRQARTDAEVVAALADPLVGDRVAGRTVVVVATPDAADEDVRGVRRMLRSAGAAVTGTLTLRPAYTDPANATSPLEDLALRLVPPNVEFADGADAADRVGTVLGRSLVQLPAEGETVSARPERDSAEVLAGLTELGALRLRGGDPGVRAEMAVVVAGADRGTAAPAVLGLVQGLDDQGRGAVLVTAGEARSGPVRWARDAPGASLSGVSTVDHVLTTAGRAALVLALAEQLEGSSGAYGTGRRAAAVLPPVRTAATDPADAAPDEGVAAEGSPTG